MLFLGRSYEFKIQKHALLPWLRIAIMLIVHSSHKMWWYGGLRFLRVENDLLCSVEIRAARHGYVGLYGIPKTVVAQGVNRIIRYPLDQYQDLVDIAQGAGLAPVQEPMAWASSAWGDYWKAHDLPWEILRIEDAVAREGAATAYLASVNACR